MSEEMKKTKKGSNRNPVGVAVKIHLKQFDQVLRQSYEDLEVAVLEKMKTESVPEKLDWNFVVNVADQVQELIRRDLSVLQEIPKMARNSVEDLLSSQLDTMKLLLLQLDCQSRVNTGVSLALNIRKSKETIIDTYRDLLEGCLKIDGSENTKDEINNRFLKFREACHGLKKTPSSNAIAIGMSINEVVKHLKEVKAESKSVSEFIPKAMDFVDFLKLEPVKLLFKMENEGRVSHVEIDSLEDVVGHCQMFAVEVKELASCKTIDEAEICYPGILFRMASVKDKLLDIEIKEKFELLCRKLTDAIGELKIELKSELGDDEADSAEFKRVMSQLRNL